VWAILTSLTWTPAAARDLDPVAAVARLTEQVAANPQDYALVLELAWMEFQAGSYDDALVHYRRAVALSDGGWTPRLGEAWCLVRLGAPEARSAVAALEQEQPDSAAVAELVAALPPRPRWRARVTAHATSLAEASGPLGSGGLQLQVASPAAPVSGDVTVDLVGYWADPGAASLSEDERARYGGDFGPGPGGDSETGPGFGGSPAPSPQGPWVPGSDGTGASGAVWGRLRGTVGPLLASGVAGVLFETLGGAPGLVVGSRASLSGPVTPTVEVSWARPPATDLDRMRVGTTLWIPVGSVAFQPGGAVQLGDSAILPSGELTVFVTRPRWAAWIGGRVGTELHTVELLFPSMVRWPDPVDGVGYAGLRLGALDHLWGSLAGTTHVLSGGRLVPGLSLSLDTPL
jgi:hypothetical protein